MNARSFFTNTRKDDLDGSDFSTCSFLLSCLYLLCLPTLGLYHIAKSLLVKILKQLSPALSLMFCLFVFGVLGFWIFF